MGALEKLKWEKKEKEKLKWEKEDTYKKPFPFHYFFIFDLAHK